MKRLSVFGGLVIVAMMVALVTVSRTSSIEAQDATDVAVLAERIAALEEQTNAQATAIADLEERVTVLESSPGAEAAPSDDAATDEPLPGAVTFDGPGGSRATTDIVELGGAYLVSATCEAGYLFLETLNVDTPDDFVYISLSGEAPYEGSAAVNFKPARYVFTVDCEGAWSLSFEPLQ